MTTETGKHTPKIAPRPWRLGIAHSKVAYINSGKDCVAKLDTSNTGIAPGPLNPKANAEHIIACVNAHDALTQERDRLRKALTDLLPMFDNDSPLLKVYATEIAGARTALEGAARSGGEG